VAAAGVRGARHVSPMPTAPSAPSTTGTIVGIVLGAIVVTFVCAFFSLSQGIRVSELQYQTDRLAVERSHLEVRAQDIQNDLNRLAKAPAVRKQAIDAGLGPLTEPIIVPAQ
jgi:hypothetical protein